MTKQDVDKLKAIIELPPWEVRRALTTFIENIEVTEKPKKLRTNSQNASIHLWLTWVADELDKQGFTLQNVVASIKRAEIRPTMENLKEVMFKPYMKAATGKDSTTQLEKHEVDKVYEGLNKFLGDNFDGLHIPFPSDDAKGRGLIEAMKLRDKLNM